MDPDDLEQAACHRRQHRLLEEMARLNVDLVVLTCGESVQWLTGAYVGPLLAIAATLDNSGRVTLVLPQDKLALPAVANEKIGFEAKWHSTMRNDQHAACWKVLIDSTAGNSGRPRSRSVAGEWSAFGPALIDAFDTKVVDIQPTMFQLRRKKEPDEIEMLTRAADANQAMYALARDLIQPGINELDLYNQLHAAAVSELGETLTYFGQDFQCNSRGGPPRDRQTQAGELYILDLGVGYRGYYSDNARTVAVDGKPTDAQQRAWRAIAKVFPLIEQTVRPGVSCRQIFEQVQEQLDAYQPWLFNHHLGHGVGLAPHESPHLNPHWDDHFAEGDFFTVEPGLYHDDLRHGIRLEQNYLVTAGGVRLLTDVPLEL